MMPFRRLVAVGTHSSTPFRAALAGATPADSGRALRCECDPTRHAPRCRASTVQARRRCSRAWRPTLRSRSNGSGRAARRDCSVPRAWCGVAGGPWGGSQRIADALAAIVLEGGGEIETGTRVTALEQLPPAGAVLLDVSPRQLVDLAGARLPDHDRSALLRFRPGAGACKIDYALHEPVPWTDPVCRRAGTVHLGGTLLEIAAAEQLVARGWCPSGPSCYVANPASPTQAVLPRPSARVLGVLPRAAERRLLRCRGSTMRSRPSRGRSKRPRPGSRTWSQHAGARPDRTRAARREPARRRLLGRRLLDLRQLLCRPVARRNHIAPRSTACICARRPRRRVPAPTACAAGTPWAARLANSLRE